MTHTDRVTRYGMPNEKKSFRISLARERLRSNSVSEPIELKNLRGIEKDYISFGIPSIVQHEQNRRNKLVLEIELSKGFAPTRLIISNFHRLIGQYFES